MEEQTEAKFVFLSRKGTCEGDVVSWVQPGARAQRCRILREGLCFLSLYVFCLFHHYPVQIQQLLLSNWIFKRFILFLILCVCAHAICVGVFLETRGVKISWSWGYRWLWASWCGYWDSNSGPLTLWVGSPAENLVFDLHNRFGMIFGCQFTDCTLPNQSWENR